MTLLQPVGVGLSLIDGPVVRAYGLPFPTRMASRASRVEDSGCGPPFA